MNSIEKKKIIHNYFFSTSQEDRFTGEKKNRPVKIGLQDHPDIALSISPMLIEGIGVLCNLWDISISKSYKVYTIDRIYLIIDEIERIKTNNGALKEEQLIKITKSNKVECRFIYNDGLSIETTFTLHQLAYFKGIYNVLFDEDFEIDSIYEFIQIEEIEQKLFTNFQKKLPKKIIEFQVDFNIKISDLMTMFKIVHSKHSWLYILFSIKANDSFDILDKIQIKYGFDHFTFYKLLLCIKSNPQAKN